MTGDETLEFDSLFDLFPLKLPNGLSENRFQALLSVESSGVQPVVRASCSVLPIARALVTGTLLNSEFRSMLSNESSIPVAVTVVGMGDESLYVIFIKKIYLTRDCILATIVTN